MRFYFDIDESEFTDEYGMDFKDAIKDGVVREISLWVYNDGANPDLWHSEVSNQIEALIKSKQNEICEMVVERVASKVAHKKAVAAITPKVSELAAIDKENVAYFEQMIDRAIAKRFGK